MQDQTIDVITVEKNPGEGVFSKDAYNNSGNSSPSRLKDEGVGMDDEQFQQRPLYSSVEAGMHHLYLSCDQVNNENNHEEVELDSVPDETLVRLITTSETDAETTSSRSERRKLPNLPPKTVSETKNCASPRSPAIAYSKPGSSKEFDDSDSHQRTRTSSFTGLTSLIWRRSTNSAPKETESEVSGVFKQTHVAIYDFIPRHSDELMLTAGDSVLVEIRHEDFWYEGVNLSTGQSGVFPSRYVADIMVEKTKELNPFKSLDFTDTHIPAETAVEVPRAASDQNQFFLRFLGSIEVTDYKGNEIICQAIKKIINRHKSAGTASAPTLCTLEVSHRGIKMIDHSQQFQRKPTLTKLRIGRLFSGEKNIADGHELLQHFFPLKNVTFCGCHPKNTRYFAFITKHPDEHRFACHVFTSDYSTEPVAIAIGESFKKFYEEYLDYKAPTEDIYLE